MLQRRISPVSLDNGKIHHTPTPIINNHYPESTSSLFENSTTNSNDTSEFNQNSSYSNGNLNNSYTNNITNNNFYMNGNFLDLETINEDHAKNGNMPHHNQHNGNHPPMMMPMNERTPVTTGGNSHSNKLLAYNMDLGQKKCSQRKNTSDSNVKLLADHNFYHVTHRRGGKHHNNGAAVSSSENNFMIPELSPSTTSSSASTASTIQHTLSGKMSKPYELTDYFKYSSKFKRGLNSSSNSLISLNSSRHVIFKLNMTLF
jgi:hypothetical protein